METIRILDKLTVDKIAAGEVVERPASVVKELVENALDAGAANITVETEDGGLTSIRVTDDGSGIAAADLPTAFLPHATSKILDAADLAKIGTLGFRGEALPSIAAVSRLKMVTKQRDAAVASYICIHGGETVAIGEEGAADGTSVTVENLFYNVPARLKFAKSARGEAALVSDLVSRLIMARPDVAIKLIQNSRTVFHSPGSGELPDAVFCVYGADVYAQSLPAAYSDGRIRVFGVVGTEKLGRANRTAQSFYVNGRYIRSQKLSFALQRAYDTRLMTGRFPFAALNIAMELEDTDVNVHPNKLDVRFRDENAVTKAVFLAASNALSARTGVTARFEAEPEPERRAKPNYAGAQSSGRKNDSREEAETPPREVFGQAAERLTLQAMPRDAFAAKPIHALRLNDSAAMPAPTHVPAPKALDKISEVAQSAPVSAPPAEKFDFLADDGNGAEILGQLFGCYWIVQQGEKAFFIDQHAAHERKLYERLLQGGVASDSQMLMVPEIVRLSPTEYALLMENLPAFAELGFEIEEFGALTVSIRAVPSIFGKPESEAFIHEAIAQLERHGRVSTVELKRASLIRSACKHAIKAGDRPDKSEIAALLAQYAREGIPMTCPHGRPVMFVMTRIELEKLFKRIV